MQHYVNINATLFDYRDFIMHASYSETENFFVQKNITHMSRERSSDPDHIPRSQLYGVGARSVILFSRDCNFHVSKRLIHYKSI